MISALSFYPMFGFLAIGAPALIGGCAAYVWAGHAEAARQRVAVAAAGGLPMLIGSVALAGWCISLSGWCVFLGMFAIWLGIGCVAGGGVLLLGLWRGADAAARQAVPALTGLLLANFPLALGYGFIAYRVMSRTC